MAEALVRLYSPVVVGKYSSRVGIERQMVRLGPGKFPVRDSELFGDGRPVAEYVIISRPFLLGVYPVTVGEYREFALDTGHGQRLTGNNNGVVGQQDELTKSDSALPVAFVSHSDAEAYHNWLNDRGLKESGKAEVVTFQLPSAAQWELAARGEAGRVYPWGDDWATAKLNSSSNQRLAVDAHPLRATPEGVQGMAGNVWQWLGTKFGDYDPKITTDPQGPKEGYPEVRGGSAWGNSLSLFRGAIRDRNYPEGRSFSLGFRSAGTY